ncbi:phosphatase PAP2 family protein [Thermococcus gammatolerans]|nr:phosphatase PAP2 family protein [Thermococcus gammatolerans]
MFGKETFLNKKGTPRLRAMFLIILAYAYWNLYSLIYPALGRWSVNYTDLLLKLPGTSHDFVLKLLLWTESHGALYLLMDTLYRMGFTGIMLGTALYLLIRDPGEAEKLGKGYLLAFLIMSVIFVIAHVYPPHLVYTDLPREYPPPGWQARPEFVLPSPHCTIDTLSFLALVRRKDKLSMLLALIPVLTPVSTVLLAEHWVWDALTGIILGYIVHRLAERF